MRQRGRVPRDTSSGFRFVDPRGEDEPESLGGGDSGLTGGGNDGFSTGVREGCRDECAAVAE